MEFAKKIMTEKAESLMVKQQCLECLLL